MTNYNALFFLKNQAESLSNSTIMSKNTIVDMKTSQFPFGQLQNEQQQTRKILIKKRILYKTQKQHIVLKQKIQILKDIYHKNIINFRYVQDEQEGVIDIFYNYVPFAFESFFQACDSETIKQIHKQLIQLIVYLAKHYLLTSFNPGRCGVILNAENKWQIKYYLPLFQVVVTKDITMLQRAVQIFTVQSLHYLDLLAEPNLNDSAHFDCDGDSFMVKCRNSTTYSTQGRSKNLFESMKQKKQRRLSNQDAFYQFAQRKSSNFSIRKSEFTNDSYHKPNASSHYIAFRSSNPTVDQNVPSNKLQKTLPAQPSASLSVIEKARMAKERSIYALQAFNKIIGLISVIKQQRMNTIQSCKK